MVKGKAPPYRKGDLQMGRLTRDWFDKVKWYFIGKSAPNFKSPNHQITNYFSVSCRFYGAGFYHQHNGLFGSPGTMHNAFCDGCSLVGIQFYSPVFQVYEQLAFQHKE